MNTCARTAACGGLGLLLALAVPAPAAAEDPHTMPAAGTRVRATTRDHGRIEGTLAWYDDSGVALARCGGCDPVWVPAPGIVAIEVYQRPPSRMEVYAAIGGFIGLGVGLLAGLPEVVRDPCAGADPFDCDTSRYEEGDSAAVRIIALSALGVGVGAVAGLAVERENAWKPVAVRWDPREGTAGLQLALRF